MDPNGKLSINLTYGKLLSRSQKIAYALLNRVGFGGGGGGSGIISAASSAAGGGGGGVAEITVKPGDPIALGKVYSVRLKK